MTASTRERKSARKIPTTRMARSLAHIRRFIIRGTLALIPIALPAIAIYLLYDFIDRRIVGLVEGLLRVSFPGMGIVLLLVVLYLVGLVASNIFGKRLLESVSHVVEHIPGIGVIYKMGRQISGSLSPEDRQVFRRPVLVPYAAPNQWQIGFVTGTLRSKTGDQLLKVFVPTPPNPATGLVYIVHESNVRDPGWTVEEALQTLMSGGIIGPETMD
jgi:uncharacterized membrane protein